jgi:hypothetical protein
MDLSLKNRKIIPREMSEFKMYLKEVKSVRFKTSRLGKSIYK